MKILDSSEINNGDHHPLIIIYKLKISLEEKSIVNDPKIKFREPNWLDPFQREAYLIMVKKAAEKLQILQTEHKNCTNEEEKKLLASQISKEISSILTQSTKATINLKKSDN